MAAAAIFNFGKNINNSGMDEDICTKFHEIMHQGHAYNLEGKSVKESAKKRVPAGIKKRWKG